LIRSRQRIALVVDDEEDICDLIEDALEDIDVDVWKASTAERAVDIAANYVIDVCFVDIFMPGKGGLWLIEKIREQHPEAEIVAISGGFDAMSDDKTMRAVEKLGVQHRLSKPFLVSDILDATVGILGGA